MEKEIILKLHKNFEECSREKNGVEFWYARELQNLLGYGRWENFENAINRAKIACEKAKQKVSDHFADATKTIPMPKGASKEIFDMKSIECVTDIMFVEDFEYRLKDAYIPRPRWR